MDKKRSSNFTHEEDQLLLDLIHKNKEIIECKRSGVVSWKQKENSWRNVEHDFNAQGRISRTNKCLKDRYKNLKKAAKMKYSQNKHMMTQTGGGTCRIFGITDIDEKIKDIIGDQMQGMSNAYDSDSVYASNNNSDIIIEMSDVQESEACMSTSLKNTFSETNLACSQIVQYSSLTPAQSMIDVNSIASYASKNDTQPNDPPSPSKDKNNEATFVEENGWTNYSSQTLKQPVSKKLRSSNTVIKRPKARAKKYFNANHELIDEKLNFVRLQKEKFLEEHHLKINLLNKKIMLKEKKLQLLVNENS